MDKTNKDIIIKHNDLIESSYHLTKIQQKIMLYVISKLNQHQDTTKDNSHIEVDFFLQDLVNTIIPENKHHSYIIQNLRHLRETTIIIKTKEDRKQNLTYTGWLAKIKHKPNQRKVRVYIDKELEPYLLHIKSFFTSYHLENVINFNNKYSFRVYELCKQYLPIGYREISIQDIRKFLKCEDKYIQFSHFRDKVILPSMKDINEKSDMIVSYETTKKKKTTTHITFYMKSKIGPKISSNHKINEIGMSQDKAEEIYNLYRNHHNELNETIDFLLDRKDRIKHFPPYAYVSLKNGIEGIIKYEKDKIKDVPKLYDDMKVKTKSGKVFTIKENVIRNEKGQIIMVEGQIIQNIMHGKFDIVE